MEKYKKLIPENINKNKKILILGCGLSTHNTVKASKQDIIYVGENGPINLLDEYNLEISNLINYFKIYQNLYISDINFDKTFILKNEIIFTKKEIKQSFRKYYLENRNSLQNNIFNWDMLDEKFILIDINKDLNKLSKFDYIDFRNVIHFSSIKLNKIDIINKLYSLLNDNGTLFIQAYTINNNSFYSVLTENDISNIKKLYPTVIIDKKDFDNKQTCYITIIKK